MITHLGERVHHGVDERTGKPFTSSRADWAVGSVYLKETDGRIVGPQTWPDMVDCLRLFILLTQLRPSVIHCPRETARAWRSNVELPLNLDFDDDAESHVASYDYTLKFGPGFYIEGEPYSKK